MKLLIVCQKLDINDDVLGFFHDWVAEFAKHCEKVTVICLEKGDYDLLDHVEVESLGKDSIRAKREKKILPFSRGVPRPKPGGGVFKRIKTRTKYLFRFYHLICKHRKDYDRVFVHMIPMYLNIGAPLWKLLGKKTNLWYAHGTVSRSLRLAGVLSDQIYTSTPSGCKLKTKKVKVVGQGIDIEKFRIADVGLRSDTFNIISIGRIAPIKDYETLIEAVNILVNQVDINNIRVRIVGGTLLEEHEKYLLGLKDLVKKYDLEDRIEFTGSIPYKDIKEHLAWADLMASTSQTGSLDKVMLEAMATCIPVISCNEATEELMGEYKNKLMYKPGNETELSERIEGVYKMEQNKYDKLADHFFQIVNREHSLNGLILKILGRSH